MKKGGESGSHSGESHGGDGKVDGSESSGGNSGQQSNQQQPTQSGGGIKSDASRIQEHAAKHPKSGAARAAFAERAQRAGDRNPNH